MTGFHLNKCTDIGLSQEFNQVERRWENRKGKVEKEEKIESLSGEIFPPSYKLMR